MPHFVSLRRGQFPPLTNPGNQAILDTAESVLLPDGEMPSFELHLHDASCIEVTRVDSRHDASYAGWIIRHVLPGEKRSFILRKQRRELKQEPSFAPVSLFGVYESLDKRCLFSHEEFKCWLHDMILSQTLSEGMEWRPFLDAFLDGVGE